MNKTAATTAVSEGSVEEVKGAISRVMDDGREKLSGLKDRALEFKDEAVEKGTSALDTVTGAIKAHPLKAVGIAFGVGYIAMRILRH